MKLRVLVFLAVCMLLCAHALAAPILSNDQVTAFIGDSNFMYLQSADGSLHRLQTPIVDLLSMDDTQLYCLTQDNRLYAVRLDGSASSLVSARVTQEDLEMYTAPMNYALADQVLTIFSDTTNMVVSRNCEAACANHTTIFYIDKDPVSGACSLHMLPMNYLTPVSVSPIEGCSVIDPSTMTASPEAVAITGRDGSIQTLFLSTGESQTVSDTQLPENIRIAICVIGKILTFTQNEDGHYLIASSHDVSEAYNRAQQMTAMTQPTKTPSVRFITPAATATPTAAPRVTATPRPTATTRVTEVPVEDNTIYYGARGQRVRKMQQRLLDLGYPVGNVDGTFGAQTLLALNLFQDAIGYTNLKSCTERCYNRLMGRSAPAFNLYRPVKKGDRGQSVEFLQRMLIILGYGPDKADGIYGDRTAEAVAKFQLYAALPVDGNLASSDTLFALYTLMNPLDNPTPTPLPTETPTATPEATPTIEPSPTAEATETPGGTPTPTAEPIVPETETPAPSDKQTETPDTTEPASEPTESQTDEPTATPSDVPTDATDAPTAVPTEEPTDAPTAVPTEEPTDAPTAEPTTEPTEVPTAAPTEEPTAVPTEVPTAAPTAVPTDVPVPEYDPSEEP